MGEFIWDIQGFADDRNLNWEKDFRLRIIHNNTFSNKEIICTPFDKFRAMGGLANREEVEERFKNTVGISTSVLKSFQFASGGFNSFSHQDGIKNLNIFI